MERVYPAEVTNTLKDWQQGADPYASLLLHENYHNLLELGNQKDI